MEEWIARGRELRRLRETVAARRPLVVRMTHRVDTEGLPPHFCRGEDQALAEAERRGRPSTLSMLTAERGARTESWSAWRAWP